MRRHRPLHPLPARLPLLLPMLFLGLSACPAASASLVVSIGDLTLAPGQSGYVEVTIRGDSATPDLLLAYNAEFRLGQVPGTSTLLQFQSPLDPTGTGQYVFPGSSSYSFTSPSAPLNDRVTVGDFGFAMLDESSNALLARLAVTPASGTFAPRLGDQFSLELVPGINTVFLDGGLAPLDVSSTPGTVTITNAIPEPASGSVWCLGLLACFVAVSGHRRRGRIAARNAGASRCPDRCAVRP